MNTIETIEQMVEAQQKAFEALESQRFSKVIEAKNSVEQAIQAGRALLDQLAKQGQGEPVALPVPDVISEKTDEPYAYSPALVRKIICVAQQLAPHSEPVAWMGEMCGPRGGPWTAFIEHRPSLNGMDATTKWTPLYTTPQQRKPMTTEKIESLAWTKPSWSLVDFARVIEAAHGIKD